MTRSPLLAIWLLAFAAIPLAAAQQNRDTNRTPVEIVSATLGKILDMVEPPEGAPPQTFYFTFEVKKSDELPKGFIDLSAKVALQLPDRLWISADAGDKSYSLGRNRQEVWVRSAAKHFGVIGKAGVARFAADPDSIDQTKLGPLKLPLDRQKLMLLPFMMDIEDKKWVDYEDLRVRVLQCKLKKEAVETLKLPPFKLKLWIDTNDLPIKVAYQVEEKKIDFQVLINKLTVQEPWADERWKLVPAKDEKVKEVALSHVTRFIDVWVGSLGEKIPPLGKKGERKVVATEGLGRLEMIDGMRVLFLKGSPDEMGHQQGVLMKSQIQRVKDHILYGVGVGSSFQQGTWFFSEIETAEKALSKHMDPDYLAEMDAMAAAAGINRQEIRLANYFPELFHCSGFCLYGKATATGKMYHGRILDYLKGVGLEQSAVVTVREPAGRNAWVNIGYAGFIGSVTAMNEKRIAIGEMGGKHDGEWDGKPMAELVREVMERANTIDEALNIMRKSPRTCEYFYVISDGNSKRAVGIRGTPTKFETIEAGEKHDRLPEPITDGVVLSADKRYEELIKRIKEKMGKIDDNAAWELMKKPVAMDSNIHCALFMPETLEFWVANAQSDKVAIDVEHREFNLLKLLKRDTQTASAATR
jgi:isopenicillin-N N-acyltransferase-like protein